MSPATTVDLHPAITFAFQIMGGVVATAVPIVVTWFLGRYLHIKAQSALGQKITAIASNAAALGLSKAQSAALTGAGAVDVKNAAIAAGVGYFNEAVSTKTLDAAKITVSIADLVEGQVQRQLTPTAQAAVVANGSAADMAPPKTNSPEAVLRPPPFPPASNV